MFSGSIVALVTPMHPDGSVDKKRFIELVEWHISEGTKGIVVNGTTGESPTLEPEEQRELIKWAVDCVNNRIPVIAGTGSYSTKHTILNTKSAFELGVDACLIITPYYNKPTQEGVYQHFSIVATESPGPIILYNHPGRTGTDILAPTLARLAQIPNIVAIKEVYATPERVKYLVNELGDKLDVLCGDDLLNLQLLELGGKGVISVTANVAPAAESKMCEAALAKDWVKAKEIDAHLQRLSKALCVESNPIPVKWALQQMGKIESGIRLPLTPLAPQFHAEVKAVLESMPAEFTSKR